MYYFSPPLWFCGRPIYIESNSSAQTKWEKGARVFLLEAPKIGISAVAKKLPQLVANTTLAEMLLG